MCNFKTYPPKSRILGKMKDGEPLYREAVELVSKSTLARHMGDRTKARNLLKAAFVQERPADSVAYCLT